MYKNSKVDRIAGNYDVVVQPDGSFTICLLALNALTVTDQVYALDNELLEAYIERLELLKLIPSASLTQIVKTGNNDPAKIAMLIADKQFPHFLNFKSINILESNLKGIGGNVTFVMANVESYDKEIAKDPFWTNFNECLFTKEVAKYFSLFGSNRVSHVKVKDGENRQNKTRAQVHTLEQILAIDIVI